MRSEHPVSPEALTGERLLAGAERERFSRELAEYVSGLEAALVDPDLPEEDRLELEEQLAALRDSQEAIARGGEVREKI